MLGLVAYESDEEDDDIQIQDAKPQEQQEAAPSIAPENTKRARQGEDESSSKSQPTSKGKSTTTTTTTLPVARSPDNAQSLQSGSIDAADIANSASSETDVYGPSLGPAPPPRDTVDTDIDDADTNNTLTNQRDSVDDDEEIEQDPELAQMSPYTRNRTLCRSYTMPTLSADFSIPETPPGSPPRDTAQRFAHFLKLKEKNVHFNSKLAQSTGLRNPNFLDKLMDYVELDKSGDGAGQYASNWRKDLWDPRPKALGVGIPRRKGESFAEALGRLQKEGFEKRQQKDRTAVEFVGSSSSASAAATAGNIVAAAPVAASTSDAPKQASTTSSSKHHDSSSNAPRSAAERVMIGLDRDSSRNSSAKNTPSRKDGGGGGGGGSRKDDRGYRERRRRSRSRSRSRDRARYRERDYRR